MAEASVPVDLFNPGQVFACLGLLESAAELLGFVEGGFDWSDEADVRFWLRANGGENPVTTILEFLAGAEVYSLAPARSELSTDGWDVHTQYLNDEEAFPFPAPPSPATLPAVIKGKDPTREDAHSELVIDHWGEQRDLTSRDNVKFWGGSGGKPGAAIARDTLDLVRTKCRDAADDPFSLSAEQTGSFRFDWRRDYIPIDLGFSLNSHSKGRFSMVGFPLVEILAAIGFTNARPERVSSLEYRYGVIGVLDGPDGRILLDVNLLRVSLGGQKMPFPQRTFRMSLGWPGKAGQARCITSVMEEPTR